MRVYIVDDYYQSDLYHFHIHKDRKTGWVKSSEGKIHFENMTYADFTYNRANQPNYYAKVFVSKTEAEIYADKKGAEFRAVMGGGKLGGYPITEATMRAKDIIGTKTHNEKFVLDGIAHKVRFREVRQRDLDVTNGYGYVKLPLCDRPPYTKLAADFASEDYRKYQNAFDYQGEQKDKQKDKLKDKQKGQRSLAAQVSQALIEYIYPDKGWDIFHLSYGNRAEVKQLYRQIRRKSYDKNKNKEIPFSRRELYNMVWSTQENIERKDRDAHFTVLMDMLLKNLDGFGPIPPAGKPPVKAALKAAEHKEEKHVLHTPHAPSYPKPVKPVPPAHPFIAPVPPAEPKSVALAPVTLAAPTFPVTSNSSSRSSSSASSSNCSNKSSSAVTAQLLSLSLGSSEPSEPSIEPAKSPKARTLVVETAELVPASKEWKGAGAIRREGPEAEEKPVAPSSPLRLFSTPPVFVIPVENVHGAVKVSPK